VSGCLGSAVAALVDGELDHAARERVHRHLTRCAACRAEVEAQRRTKARVRTAAAPAPSDALSARLLALGASLPSDARPQDGLERAPLPTGGQAPGTVLLERRAAVAPSAGGRALAGGLGRGRSAPAGAGAPPGRPVPARALRRRAGAGSAFALLGVAAALALGAPPPRATSTPLTPAEQAFVTQPVTASGPAPSPSGLRTSPGPFVPVTRAALLTSTPTVAGRSTR
jgi:hypothetical protein